MEKIEQVLELPKFNAAIVAHNNNNPSLLSILLSDEESEESNSNYGWYLYIEHLGPTKRVSPAYIELDSEEVQFLQTTLNKALFKLTILEKVKVNGFYSLSYDGIKNLKLEMKSKDGNAWLELILLSKSQKKYITILTTGDVRAVLQKLQTVKVIGETMMKELEAIEALTENLTTQTALGQKAAPSLPAPIPPIPTPSAQAPTPTVVKETTAQPIDGTKLVKHLENIAHTNKPKMIY